MASYAAFVRALVDGGSGLRAPTLLLGIAYRNRARRPWSRISRVAPRTVHSGDRDGQVSGRRRYEAATADAALFRDFPPKATRADDRPVPEAGPSRTKARGLSRVKIRKNEDLLGLTEIEVIGASGDRLGVMPPAEALRLAREQRLDLVEVNPMARPPVCKILNLASFKYEEAKQAALRRRGPPLMVFLVRSKLVVRGCAGTFLVGDLVTGDAVRAGMVAHIPGAHDVVHALPIISVEFVDHRPEKTSELGLHVAGGSPEQVAAIEALDGAHLIEITERPT
jgi:hypothetical protein